MSNLKTLNSKERLKSVGKPKGDVNKNKAADALIPNKIHYQSGVEKSPHTHRNSNYSKNQMNAKNKETLQDEPRGEFERGIDISTTALSARTKSLSIAHTHSTKAKISVGAAFNKESEQESMFDNFNAQLVPLSRRVVRSNRVLAKKQDLLAKTSETPHFDQEDFAFTRNIQDLSMEETYEAFNQSRISSLRKSPARIVRPCRQRHEDSSEPYSCGALTWSTLPGEVRIDSQNIGTPRFDPHHSVIDPTNNKCYFLHQNTKRDPWKSGCPCIPMKKHITQLRSI